MGTSMAAAPFNSNTMPLQRHHLFVALLAVIACGSPHAMDFKLIGSTLVMSGPVIGDDLARLKDQLATKAVKLIVLHESAGGDLWNGLHVGERIREEGLPTAVSGKCESACGLIFLGGVQRSFSDGRSLAKSMIGLHGAFNRETKEAMPSMGAKMAYFMRRMTDNKYPSELAERTVYPKDPRNFIFFFHPKRFKDAVKPKGVMECEVQADAKFKCTMLGDADALSFGVISDLSVVELDAQVKDALREQ
jgi:hypothetical protein